MATQLKTCPLCGKAKSLDMFHHNKWMKDGYSFYCKDCISNQQRNYRKNNREKVRERSRIQDRKLKERAKNYFSNFCCVCNKKLMETKHDYTIHHRGNNHSKGYKTIRHPEEWGECCLMCVSCHQALHVFKNMVTLNPLMLDLLNELRGE